MASIDPTPVPTISVPLAITLGLVASFIQSLGLTIQRKSHLHNQSLPTPSRRSDWRRPLWVIGFLIFLFANLGGTIFQIGALPIVILAPLGAVSLLYNALLARFLLDDFFSAYMLLGTLLIALGAVMIGYFGVVQEPPHDLDRLLDLFARPPFVAFVTVFLIALVGILVIAHLAEWSMHTRLLRQGLPSSASRRSTSRHRKSSSGRCMQRSWSAPHLAPLLEVPESSSGVATPALAMADEAARRGLPIDRLLANASRKKQANSIEGVLAAAASANENQNGGTTTTAKIDKGPAKGTKSNNASPSTSPRRDYGTLPTTSNRRSPHRSKPPRLDISTDLRKTSFGTGASVKAESANERTKLGLAITYGGASGTLSGACLLLAKSGVELVVLSLAGDNQFNRWQSFALVGTLLFAAVLQLWYLNKGLKLADPTLLCPLAFCFYNTSSIVLGLVYFDQLGALSGLSILMVMLGTVVLLSGVWMVSMHGRSTSSDMGVDVDIDETRPLLIPSSQSTGSLTGSISGSGSAHLLSPTDPGFLTSPTEMEALMGSNVAGIAGPHLPPLESSAVDHHYREDIEANAGAGPGIGSLVTTSPSPPNSPFRYRGMKKRHTRSFSSASGYGGLGLALPSFGGPPDGVGAGVDRRSSGGGESALAATVGQISSEASTSAAGQGSGSAIDDDAPSPTSTCHSPSPSQAPSPSVTDVTAKGSGNGARRRMLYRALLERGLSVGIGVSSPGFQVRSVLSPQEEEEVEIEEQIRAMRGGRGRGWWGGGGRGRGDLESGSGGSDLGSGSGSGREERRRGNMTAPEQRRSWSESGADGAWGSGVADADVDVGRGASGSAEMQRAVTDGNGTG